MSAKLNTNKIDIKVEPMESEIKIENFGSDDDIKNEVKTDPDRDFLLIISGKNHQQTIIKEEEINNEDPVASDKSVECKICNKNILHLKSHMKIVHPEEYRKECEFHCDLCASSYKFKQNLITHMMAVHINKVIKHFQCDYDGKVFEIRGNIREHMKRHLSNVKCKICSKEIKVTSLLSHIKQIHPSCPSNQCQICSKEFKTELYLKLHMKIHDKKFECKECGMKFALNFQLKKHLVAHNDALKVECKICLKKFFDKYRLHNHMRTHQQHRPKHFECSHCNYATDSKYVFINHMKTHDKNRIKNLKCSQCEYATDSKHLLRKHLKTHDKERQKLLKCSKCDHATDNKTSLSKHMKTHDKARVKKHKCNRCDYATDECASLKVHAKFHAKHVEKVKTWKNPIKCEKCWIFCKDKYSLKSHMGKVHVDAKFQCDLCGKLFKIKPHILEHFRLAHKIKI